MTEHLLNVDDLIEAGNPCPMSEALKLIGDRWVLLIIRDLFMHGPCRFSDFEKCITGINPTTLSSRLKKLEDGGLIERRIYNDRPPRAEYRLTEAGKDLKPLLLCLMEWGRKHASIDPASILKHKAPKSAKGA